LSEGRCRSNSFPNSAVGFERLVSWLGHRKVERVHACLEATGGWSEDLAAFLHDHGHAVSVVNPSTIKSFGQSELSRTKTDKADAALIARYCSAMKPRLWTPPSPSQRRLQRLGRRRVALDEMRTQERNRWQGPGIDEIRPSIEATLAFLSRQIADLDAEMAQLIEDDPELRAKRDLLKSIPGIGERVATTLLGELPQMTEFRNGKALSALRRAVSAGVSLGEFGWCFVALEDGCSASSSGAVHAFDHGDALQSGAVGVCGSTARQRQASEANHRCSDASAFSAGLRRAEIRPSLHAATYPRVKRPG